MSSWEEIADEIAPSGKRPGGLATGALRRPVSATPKMMRRDGELPVIVREPDLYHIPCPPHRRGMNFDEAFGGVEVQCATHGLHYAVSRAATAYGEQFAGLAARLCRALATRHFKSLCARHGDELLFLDIETTGLSAGAPLFLIGVLHCGDEPRLEFLLARDFGEERAVLAALQPKVEGRHLVTFNGRSFDWPYITARAARHGLPFVAPRGHLDLLHHARRNWKHGLPDCRLQTLERHHCRRERRDDIPSGHIPGRYHEFVARRRAGAAAAELLIPIMHHNALDLLTMAELMCRDVDPST